MLSQWLLLQTLDSTHVRPGILERGTHKLTISLWKLQVTTHTHTHTHTP